MWEGIDFAQFGPFAIVFVIMGVLITKLYSLWNAAEKKVDDERDARLTETKQARDSIVEPLNKLIVLVEQLRQDSQRINRGE